LLGIIEEESYSIVTKIIDLKANFDGSSMHPISSLLSWEERWSHTNNNSAKKKLNWWRYKW